MSYLKTWTTNIKYHLDSCIQVKQDIGTKLAKLFFLARKFELTNLAFPVTETFQCFFYQCLKKDLRRDSNYM